MIGDVVAAANVENVIEIAVSLNVKPALLRAFLLRHAAARGYGATARSRVGVLSVGGLRRHGGGGHGERDDGEEELHLVFDERCEILTRFGRVALSLLCAVQNV